MEAQAERDAKVVLRVIGLQVTVLAAIVRMGIVPVVAQVATGAKGVPVAAGHLRWPPKSNWRS